MKLTTEASSQVKQDMWVLTGSSRSAMLTYAAGGESIWSGTMGWVTRRNCRVPQPIFRTGTELELRQRDFLCEYGARGDSAAPGCVDAAKAYLLATGKSQGSPQLNSFGPNMSLAKDLFEAGERQAVVTFFDDCVRSGRWIGAN